MVVFNRDRLYVILNSIYLTNYRFALVYKAVNSKHGILNGCKENIFKIYVFQQNIFVKQKFLTVATQA